MSARPSHLPWGVTNGPPPGLSYPNGLNPNDFPTPGQAARGKVQPPGIPRHIQPTYNNPRGLNSTIGPPAHPHADVAMRHMSHQNGLPSSTSFYNISPVISPSNNGISQASSTTASSSFKPKMLVESVTSNGSSQGEAKVLDRFASIYVPQWLLNVNAAPPSQVLFSSQFSAKDYTHTYAESLFPKALLDRIIDEETETNTVIHKLLKAKTVSLTKLAADKEKHYAFKLITLQMEEHVSRKADLADSNLYQVTLERYRPEPAAPAIPHLYTLQAPSIREDFPPIGENDIVVLRQLVPQYFTWQGIEFVATVHAVRRVAALIILKCEPLSQYLGSMQFTVSFRPQDRPFFAAHKGLLYLDRQLKSTPPDSSLCQAWLFPNKEHDTPFESNDPLYPTRQDFIPSYYDQKLNVQQQEAVLAIVTKRRRVPFLISGPPGTGKTKTLVETVLQILEAYSDAHVLVCGASNASSDTLAVRLSQHLSPKQLFRLNDQTRPIEEINSRLLPWCDIDDGKFVLPPPKRFLQYRVIVTSCLDASVLLSAGLTNSGLSRLEDTIVNSLHPELPPRKCYHFDYLLIDEAAQASEPEVSCALAVVLPDQVSESLHEYVEVRRLPQLILCGDHMQLGPALSSHLARTHELDVSLVQRLFERPLYKEHPRARHNVHVGTAKTLLGQTNSKNIISASPTTSSTVAGVLAPFANLINNYRSHVGLLMVPSALFYNDTLVPMAGDEVQNTPLMRWQYLTNKDVPLLISHTEGQEEMFEEGASWFNTAEVDKIVKMVESLVSVTGQPIPGHGKVHPSEISIIAPFREQVWRIRMALRKKYLGEVNVGKETDMQGAENRVVMISTVRTTLRFVDDDRRRNRGLLFDAKRFNVATTRAKELLVVVGSANTLYSDPYWRAMITFALRRGAYGGPSLKDLGVEEEPLGGISKLEEESVLMQRGPVSEEMLASSVARMVLAEN